MVCLFVTPLREGRPYAYFKSTVPYYFNSRPSARGDAAVVRGRKSGHYFNSRPSARGDVLVVIKTSTVVYFNSRPSARGDEIAEKQDMSAGISIHAPPRGATSPSRILVLFDLYFNSRPSARGDTSGELAVWVDKISIHAPPRGATQSPVNVVTRLTIFQFTPLREGRRSRTW